MPNKLLIDVDENRLAIYLINTVDDAADRKLEDLPPGADVGARMTFWHEKLAADGFMVDGCTGDDLASLLAP